MGRDRIIPIRELVGGILLTSGIFLAGVAVPVAGFLVSLFSMVPVLAAVLRSRRRWMAFAVIGGVYLLLAAGFAGSGAGIVFLVEYGLPAVVLCELRRYRPPTAAVIMTALICTAALTGGISLLAAAHGEPPAIWVGGLFAENLTAVRRLYAGMGVPAAQLALLEEMQPVFSRWAGLLFPTLAMLGYVAIGGVNLRVAVRFIPNAAPAAVTGGAFGAFATPPRAVWVLIAAGFGLLLPGLGAVGRFLLLNAVGIMLVLYLVQGLAVCRHFFEVLRVGAFGRLLWYVLLLTVHFLIAAVVLCGLFDQWFDFRRYARLPVDGPE